MTMINTQQMWAEIEHISNTIEATAVATVKKVALEVFRSLVEKTPVDTGFARAGWKIGVNEVVSPSGEDQSDRIESVNTLKDFITITSYVPYILRLNAGHSGQAPAGFIEMAVSEVAESNNARI